MAYVADKTNRDIQKLIDDSVAKEEVDTSQMYNARTIDDIDKELEDYILSADVLKDTQTGSNTFTIGNKDKPISATTQGSELDSTEGLLNDTSSTDTLSKEDKKLLDKKLGNDSTNLTFNDNSNTPINIDDDSIISFNAQLDEIEPTKGISIDTLPTDNSSLSNRIDQQGSTRGELFKKWLSSGKEMDRDTGLQILTGNPETTKESLLKDYSLKALASKGLAAAMTTHPALGDALAATNDYIKKAQDVLEQADTYKKQFDSVVELLTSACGTEDCKSIDIDSLFGNGGPGMHIGPSPFDNAVLDAWCLFKDKSISGMLADLTKQASSPGSSEALQNLMCNLVNGDMSGKDALDYIKGRVKASSIAQWVGLAQSLIKDAVANDDPKLLIDMIDDPTKMEIIYATIRSMNYTNIEEITKNCANRGAPRALAKILEILGIYRVRHYRYKLLQAHINDPTFDPALFLEHQSTYQLSIDDFQYGNLDVFGVGNDNRFNSNHVRSLNLFNLKNIKNSTYRYNGTTDSFLSDDNVMLLSKIPLK